MYDYYLAGDVGGTRTRLALCSKNKIIPEYEVEYFFSSDYYSLESLIEKFLDDCKVSVGKAVIAVAGPVINNAVKKESSNLPWEVSLKGLSEINRMGEVRLINDLEALAVSIGSLKEKDLHVLHKGSSREGETLAVIAPGTGLGEAFLLWDGSLYQPCISEGSHVNYGPFSDLELELLKYMRRKHKHVTYELLCSGLGIPSIYDFLVENSIEKEPAVMKELMTSASDKVPVIQQAAFGEGYRCRLAERTMEIFVSILGAEAGNLVLKTMATGGIYLGGGIPHRILPMLNSNFFFQPFRSKGIMSDMMENIPVQVITNADAAIMGAVNILYDCNTFSR